MPQIMVVGSLNMDLVVRMPVIPRPGETLLGGRFATFPGGKGANQAVAAARLGGQVTLVGRVGNDAFGQQLRDGASREGIDIRFIGVDEQEATGVALIEVDAQGQNSIAVASGANFRLTAADVEAAFRQAPLPDLLVMPLETPPETILAAAALARKGGGRVVLNPAPARPLEDELLRLVDVLAPNEFEAELLTGIVVSDEDAARRAAMELLGRGVRSVALTMGGRGVLLAEGGASQLEFHRIQALPVRPVDTTAAGDGFVGALAVALGEGRSLLHAAQFANAAAAISVTRLGAQPSLPLRAEVEEMLKN
jgi:ribokinase